MGQKVHPLGLRLGITQEHRSKWYSSQKNYANLVLEDFYIRNFLQKTYKESGIVDITIDRKLDQVQITIKAVRPGLFLGKNNEKVCLGISNGHNY